VKSVKSILLLTLAVLSHAAVAQKQIITADPVSQGADSNVPVSFDVNYSTENPEDETLTGLGLIIYWDSSKLTFDGLTDFFTGGELYQASPSTSVGQPTADAQDGDGDANTDMMLVAAWADGFMDPVNHPSAEWPGDGTTPLRLFTANFTTADSFTDTDSTAINITSSSTAAGYTMDSVQIDIGAGGGLPGDANGDGLINALDLVATANEILGISSAAGNPDCNQDGQVNSLDLVCIANKILGL